ncbi:MAG: endonuclease III [Clostridiales bacterium]|nr:endonuclease III [Clostridiales bacterium]
MTDKKLRERAAFIEKELEKKYPAAECALKYEGDAWRLLIMGRLSAQCTDARVNIVCRELFEKYPTAKDLASADVSDVEKIVYPCGVYRVKAANIIAESKMICDDFGGVVPADMESLLRLPGVGRKIANLILGDIYGKPAIVADTHCIRISNRLGLVSGKTPEKVESALRELITPETSADFCHRLVMFGREVCNARSPKCEGCPFESLGCIK